MTEEMFGGQHRC